MFLQRVIVAVLLLPLGLAALFSGEIPFAVLTLIVAEIAVFEYIRLFRIGGYQLAEGLIYVGVGCIFAANLFFGIELGIFGFILFSLFIVAWHLWRFQNGRERTLQDMPVSLTGIFLLGFLAGYFVALRRLPGGEWWVLILLFTVILADVGGYMFGSWFGKHLIAPAISPKKTWEGYIAGIIVSVGGSSLLLMLYRLWGFPVYEGINTGNVVFIASIMSVFSILGDLLISLIKRNFGEKDTGRLLPGHGGMLDRIDNWIWAVALGYYLISAIILS